MSNFDRLVKDLHVNFDEWRVAGSKIKRRLSSQYSNTPKGITIFEYGEVEVDIGGEHNFGHTLRPSWLERRAIKKARAKFLQRLADTLFVDLGVKKEAGEEQ